MSPHCCVRQKAEPLSPLCSVGSIFDQSVVSNGIPYISMAAPLVIECPCGEPLATEIHLLLKGEIGHGGTESQRNDRSELIRNADTLHLVFCISSSLCVSVSLWLTSFSAPGLEPGRPL